VQFSNHTGYPKFSGEVLSPKTLQSMYETLKSNGLNRYTHVLTGYMNNPEMLGAIIAIVNDLKRQNPDLVYVCDPVMGDDGKLYASVPMSMVHVYQKEVLTKVNILLPNQTECEFLTSTKISDQSSAFHAIQILHNLYNIQSVVITSIDIITATGAQQLLVVGSQKVSHDHNNVSIDSSGTVNTYQRFKASIPRIPAYFSGTGDLFAALILGWTSKGLSLAEATQCTLKSLQSVLTFTLKNVQQQQRDKNSSIHNSETVSMRTHEIKLIESFQHIAHPSTSNQTPFDFEIWTETLSQ